MIGYLLAAAGGGFVTYIAVDWLRTLRNTTPEPGGWYTPPGGSRRFD
jgi:hypothetical protein